MRTIHACSFKRKATSKWEKGITFDEGAVIIDENNKTVRAPIYDYMLDDFILSLNVEHIFQKAEE